MAFTGDLWRECSSPMSHLRISSTVSMTKRLRSMILSPRSIRWLRIFRRMPVIRCRPRCQSGSCRVPGWWIASCDEGANQGPEQSFSAPPCVMHELKEAEIKRQLVLRDTTVRAQPGPQQRPEAFNRVDVDLAEAITVFVACILTAGMAHRLVAVAPSR